MFEFKLTSDGKIVLIEINPRIWGSINQGLQNGVNYFEDILGKPTQKNQNDKKVNTYLSPVIYLSLFQYLIRFKFKPISYFFHNIRKNRPDVGLFDDPLGYISMLIRII